MRVGELISRKSGSVVGVARTRLSISVQATGCSRRELIGPHQNRTILLSTDDVATGAVTAVAAAVAEITALPAAPGALINTLIS